MTRRSRVRPPVTDDLAEWCPAHGLDCVVLSPAQTRARSAPIALDSTPHPNFARQLVAQMAERFLVCVPQTRVWGANGLVILPDGSFAAQAIYDRSHLVADLAYSTPTPPRVVRKVGDHPAEFSVIPADAREQVLDLVERRPILGSLGVGGPTVERRPREQKLTCSCDRRGRSEV